MTAHLFYDARDLSLRRHGDHRFEWLQQLGAQPLQEAPDGASGFLFAAARSIEDYRALVQRHPRLRDRAEERLPLLRLDSVLAALKSAGVELHSPRTWTLGLDESLPTDVRYPLFVRTAESSWKLGGRISRVCNDRELLEESEALRRAIRWDAPILAREWLDPAEAGSGMYGPIPQEIRTWTVDGRPVAWSFHYLQVLPHPHGFPPSSEDLERLRSLASHVGKAFSSRLVVADFARHVDRSWYFIEAGPGSCAGTAHEGAFEAVAAVLLGQEPCFRGDDWGGPL